MVVTVHVSGLRRERGVALVALFDASRASRDPGHAIHVGAAPIVGTTATMVFRDVAPGRYVAALLRAEDDASAPRHADLALDLAEDRGDVEVELVPHEILHAP